MIFKELEPTKFDKFACACPRGNFLQSREMYDRYQKNHTESYLLGLEKDDKILAAALVRTANSRFGKIFKISGGPILDYDAKNAKNILSEFTKNCQDFCRKKGGIVLQISPNVVSEPRDITGAVISGKNHLDIKSQLISLGFKYLGEHENAKWTYIIETKGKSADSLFPELRRNHQRLIKRAEKSGLIIRDLAKDELKILKSISEKTGERHGFEDPSLKYYQEMSAAFGDKVKFKVCELPEENGKITPIMAGMFIYYGDEIVCPYSGSLKEYQRYGGAHLMHWGIIKEAINLGISRYNLYGTHPDPESGIYHFKQGFNGRIEELLGTFILPLNTKGKIYAFLAKPTEYASIH